MVENMKKGQPYVNILYQNKGCYSEAEESHHTQKALSYLKDLQTQKILRHTNSTSDLS